jgi:hypothetical protein
VRLYPHTDEEISHYAWTTFINNCVYCTNIQGSALYDATLGDKEMIDQMFEDAKARQSMKIKEVEKPEEEWRPSRRGYTREVEALYDVASNIVALRGELGKWNRTTSMNQMPRRPWMPQEVVEARMAHRSRTIRDEKIKAAQQRHRERRLASGG